MRYQWATATHRGRVRPNNQDRAYPETAGRAEETAVVMVADGMGGAVGGEIASGIAVETASRHDGDPATRVAAANSAILEEVERSPHLAGMGTTMTLVELQAEGTAQIAHVGDSRAYLLREGDMRQLTVDHTVVNEYVMAGKLTREQAATHPQRSMLTRALGLTPDILIDEFEEPLQPGDRLLLCSDGLNGMLHDDTIADIIGAGTPEEAAWSLVDEANRAGGLDNVTVLIVDVEP